VVFGAPVASPARDGALRSATFVATGLCRSPATGRGAGLDGVGDAAFGAASFGVVVFVAVPFSAA
jgi:hypothetical protein